MKKLIILPLILLFFNILDAQVAKDKQNDKATSEFVEKSTIEITENADRTLKFKNVGGNSSGVKLSMPLNGGGMSFDGFYAGTLLIVGESGLTIEPADLERAEYKIACTYKVQKGSIMRRWFKKTDKNY